MASYYEIRLTALSQAFRPRVEKGSTPLEAYEALMREMKRHEPDYFDPLAPHFYEGADKYRKDSVKPIIADLSKAMQGMRGDDQSVKVSGWLDDDLFATLYYFKAPVTTSDLQSLLTPSDSHALDFDDLDDYLATGRMTLAVS